MRITPVILSGGSGTRLWPLSRRQLPKQFVALAGPRTLFQQTMVRVAELDEVAAPIVVGNHGHMSIIAAQADDIDNRPHVVIAEPEGRNTAPAVALAAHAMDPDDLMLVLPSDSFIADEAAFRAAVRSGVEPADRGWLVTFGVTPTRPETGYGYIETGESRGGWASVSRFVEKPDVATATAYVSGGRHLWNAGMFLFSARRFLDELNTHAGEVARTVDAAWRDRSEANGIIEPGPSFASSPAISIDHAVMEHSSRVAVVPMTAGWSDVGSWHALWELGSVQDEVGNENVTVGRTVLRDVSGSYIRSDDRVVAVIGLDDVVVVDTPDVLLVASRHRSQDVKLLFSDLPEELR